jgi:thiamine biosynthesis lipoprotein ApbE
LGGIAKGYIVDCLYGLLENALPGAEITINAGGDLRVGNASAGVEINIPGSSGQSRFSLELEGAKAVATSSCLGETVSSGIPSARYPQGAKFRFSSATVVASSCALSDALTKVALSGEVIDPSLAQVYVFDREGKIA